MKLKNLKSVFKNALKAMLAFVFVFNISSCLNDKTTENANSTTTEVGAKIESVIDLSTIKIGYCTPSLNAPYYKALSVIPF